MIPNISGGKSGTKEVKGLKAKWRGPKGKGGKGVEVQERRGTMVGKKKRGKAIKSASKKGGGGQRKERSWKGQSDENHSRKSSLLG